MTRIQLHLYALTFAWLSGSGSAIPGGPCAVMDGEIVNHKATTLEDVVGSTEIADDIKGVARVYSTARVQDQVVAQVFPEALVYEILGNPTMPYYGRVFGAVLKDYQTSPSAHIGREKLMEAFRRVLEIKVPASTIEGRIRDMLAPNITLEMMRRALGDNNLTEENELYHGGDPEHPTPESLLGRYLAETGAKTLVRRHKYVDLQGKDAEGPPRAVVLMSAATLPAFMKYFQREDFTSVIAHGALLHNGKMVGISAADFRVASAGMALPVTLLKTTEGQRMAQYFRLYQKSGWGWGKPVDQPWRLPGYTANGGYTCCTQWIGNIPIGDKLVDAYTFPGRFETRQPPQTQPLKKYLHEDPLMHRVWSVPGHEQFSWVIGQGEANSAGDFAATSLVAATLLGPTSLERVPFVFQTAVDHTLPVPEQYRTAH